MGGLDVLRALRSSVATRGTPVIVATSKRLAASDREALETLGAAIMQKDILAGEGAPALFRQALSRVGLPAN
jgi:CheY-like chemotaxis protein